MKIYKVTMNVLRGETIQMCFTIKALNEYDACTEAYCRVMELYREPYMTGGAGLCYRNYQFESHILSVEEVHKDEKSHC